MAAARTLQHTGSLRRLKALTPEREQWARQALHLAARHRWQRNMDDSRVALAGENEVQARKLAKEAAACLAIDWPRCFPGELPPEDVTLQAAPLYWSFPAGIGRIDIPFFDLVVFLFKLTLAWVPAAIVVGIIYGLFAAVCYGGSR